MNFGGLISSFASWLLKMLVKLVAAVWDLFTDLFINLADLALSAVAALIVAIPAPAFLQSVNLQSAFASIGPDVLYFIGVFNIGTGIALLGSGFAFRMVRKVVTLFQW